MPLTDFSYEYFNSANVVLELEGFPVLEAAGFSMNIQENKIPIYGYSSRFFDAVARGQVIVTGSLVVNYVHQDYLYQAIKVAHEGDSNRGAGGNGFKKYEGLPPQELENAIANDPNALQKELIQNYKENVHLAEAFKGKYWDADPSSLPDEGNLLTSTNNLHDMYSSVDIRVTYGPRESWNNYDGMTGFLLSGVYFLSRGQQIPIDENVIVEEYTFIARNVHSIRPSRIGQNLDDSDLDRHPIQLESSSLRPSTPSELEHIITSRS